MATAAAREDSEDTEGYDPEQLDESDDTDFVRD
jgi:hypothetical protein